MNREQRKAEEAKRIATIADGALKVKLADLLDNTSDIMRHDRGFGRVYLAEKERILSCLYPRILDCKDPIILELYHRARSQVEFYKNS